MNNQVSPFSDISDIGKKDGYSFNIHSKMLHVGNMVRNLINPNIERIDPFERGIMLNDLKRLLIMSYGMDKIFGQLQTNSKEQEKFSNLISIVVYNSNKEIEYVNDAYLKATGLESKEQIIELSKKGTLYEEIYEGEDLSNTLKMIATLDDPNSWGYMNEIFKMKRTGRKLKWNTIKNRQRDITKRSYIDHGNVRVAIDITDIPGFEELLDFERGDYTRSFGFVNTLLRFKISFLTLLDMHQDIKNSISPSEWQKYTELMNILEHMSQIGDIIVDQGPLLVNINHAGEIFFNTRFLDVSSYGYAELNDIYRRNDFGNILFRGSRYAEFCKEIEATEAGKEMIAQMKLTRKGGDDMDILWNAMKYSKDGYQFWLGTIMSPLLKR